jgi:hypothetical protein
VETFLTRMAVRVTVVLVVSATGYWTLGGSNKPGTASPTRPPISAAATVRPVAVQPSVSPMPGPTPDARLDALWTLISDKSLSYHLSGKGLNTGTAIQERFTMELDISGDDYAGEVNSIGSSGKGQLVRKDDVMYVRSAGTRKWIVRPVLYDSVIQFAPFLDIRAKNNLEFDGVDTSGKQTLYRYTSTNQYQPDVAHMMDLSRFSTRCDTMGLALLVTDAAIPVSAHFQCSIGDKTYLGTSDYRFTEVGESFSIKPPTKPPA